MFLQCAVLAKRNWMLSVTFSMSCAMFILFDTAVISVKLKWFYIQTLVVCVLSNHAIKVIGEQF